MACLSDHKSIHPFGRYTFPSEHFQAPVSPEPTFALTNVASIGYKVLVDEPWPCMNVGNSCYPNETHAYNIHGLAKLVLLPIETP